MINARPYLIKVFNSRFKKVSEETLTFCVDEIDKMNLTEEMLIDGTEDIINDDEMAFTLPKIKKAYRNAKIKWLEKNNKFLPYEDVVRCDYCQNTGLTLFALKFDKLGNLISQNTVMRCHCEKALNDLKHLRNEKNIRMNVKDGYIKAYTKSQWAYIMPIITKTKKDIITDWQNDTKFKEFCKKITIQNESIRSLAKRAAESIPKID